MDAENEESRHTNEEIFEKILKEDYFGARTLILQALKISPWFNHSSELLTVCDILCSADSSRRHYGIDWYMVLQIGPSAEPAQIEDKHSMLISQLNSVKNDLPGTELALNFVKEAYTVLSDPVKRADFDCKRSQLNGTHCQSFPWENAGSRLDMDNPVAMENDIAERNLDPNYSYKSKMPAREDPQDDSDQQPKKMWNHEASGTNESSPKIVAGNMIAETNLDIPGSSVNEKAMHVTSASTNNVDAPLFADDMNCKDKESTYNVDAPFLADDVNCKDKEQGGSNAGVLNSQVKWSANDFEVEQVWAVYDGLDGLPRSYVTVTDVVSPSTVSVIFLEQHPMFDDEIHWVEENLPIACGVFRAGSNSMANLDMSQFSHLVRCDRSTKKSFYRIFPRKGEVWAIYKNWNKNWKSSDFVGYQCQVVEILSDFSEESGTNICCLVGVQGYLTFFIRKLHEGFQLTKQLQRSEMRSLSHRIPAFKVVDIKNHAIPRGSWHLEPDALPPRLSK